MLNLIPKDVVRLILKEVLNQVTEEYYHCNLKYHYFLARAQFSPMTQEILRQSQVCRMFHRVLREITQWGNGRERDGKHFYRLILPN